MKTIPFNDKDAYKNLIIKMIDTFNEKEVDVLLLAELTFYKYYLIKNLNQMGVDDLKKFNDAINDCIVWNLHTKVILNAHAD